MSLEGIQCFDYIVNAFGSHSIGGLQQPFIFVLLTDRMKLRLRMTAADCLVSIVRCRALEKR